MFISKIGLLTTGLFLFTSFSIAPASSPSNKNHSHTDVKIKVSELLRQMTLEEKVGQMTQVTIDVVADANRAPGGWQQLDPQKLRTAIVEHHVGSILNVMESGYTLDNWHEIITQIQDVATRETRLGIPVLYGIDAIHGANYTIGATLFPQSIGMAATWNPELVRKAAEITALEVRASGIPWNFNPVLGAGRQPLWPRLWETYGEDTYLASVLARAYVKGLEGENNNIGAANRVAACIKHYLGYSYPATGKDRTPAYLPERQLREQFLPIFKAAIDAGAHTLMVNSGEINGIPVHGSRYYLTELLRNELGFEGFAVSDWEDVIRLHTRHRVAETPKEAVRQAVMAGIDMSMVPYDFSFYTHLVELVREGSVPMSRIDEAVGRILLTKFELGLFDNPYPNDTLREEFATMAAKAVCLQAARESITLLRNENQILPLPDGTKILVTGPTANKLTALNGGWTITWQGNDESLYPKEKDTILEAVQKRFGAENVQYVPGATFTNVLDVKAAVKAAKQADVALVCLGEDAYCETPGNIVDLTLPKAQLDLAAAIAKTGTPMVLILAEGRPRLITDIAEKAQAIVMAYLPGMEGGTALAEILAGDVNPSGRLPLTYPRYPNDFTLYDHKVGEVAPDIQQVSPYNPLFEFGYGLSYTTYTYRDLQLTQSEIAMGEPLQVSVVVENTGKRAGQEVVQLYLSDLFASVTPCVKRLKRFQKIALEPGESKTVTFTLQTDDFAFIGRDNRPVVEPGEFQITIENLKAKFTLRGDAQKY